MGYEHFSHPFDRDQRDFLLLVSVHSCSGHLGGVSQKKGRVVIYPPSTLKPGQLPQEQSRGVMFREFAIRSLFIAFSGLLPLPLLLVPREFRELAFDGALVLILGLAISF